MIRLLRGLSLACCLFSGFSVAADDVPAVRTTEIAPGFHLLQGRGGNVLASVGEQGILIIDSDYPALAPGYEVALAGLGQEANVPVFLVNTHWHGDHTGGNAFWGEKQVTIVAHDNVRQRMSTRQDMKALNSVVEPSAPIALPGVTFGDSLALHFNGDDVEVQHFPEGHTDGDSIVFFSKANVIHMGDHFFKDAFPFVDLGSGGNLAGYMANVSRVLGQIDEQTVIVPGHGATVANKADLQRYLAMLQQTTTFVNAALDDGQSVAQITERGLDSRWAAWGAGFINEERWIATIAASR